MPLDSEQLKRGLRALYGFIASKADAASSTARLPLFEEDEFIYLQIALKKTPVKATTKPARIPLQHSLYAADTECCLIIKDPPRAAAATASASSASSSSSSSAGIKEYFAAHPVPGLSRIVTVHKLRSEYARFKDRRELLALYDLFLADDRVLPVLPAVLGSKFFDKKKQPMPVNLTLRDKAREVQAALSSTALFVPAGSCLVLRVGRTSFSRQQVEDNIAGCVENVVHRLPGKWRNVQMIGVKTKDSITIPLYASLPLQQIRGAAAHNGVDTEEMVEDDGVQEGDDNNEDEDEQEEQTADGAVQEREEEGEDEEDEQPVPAVQRKRKREESDAGVEKLPRASTGAAATGGVRSSAAAPQPPPVAKQRKTEAAASAPAVSLAAVAAGKKATAPTAVSAARKAATVALSPRSSSRQAGAGQGTAAASASKKRKTEEQPAAAAAARTEAASSRQTAEAGTAASAARRLGKTKQAEEAANVKSRRRQSAETATAESEATGRVTVMRKPRAAAATARTKPRL